MNHIFLGSAVPFLIAMIIFLLRRGRTNATYWVLTPLAMAMGAAWACLPDVPRLLGMYDLYMRMAEDPHSDIFFWHYSIDRVETDTPLYLVTVAGMAICLLIGIWREVRLRETSTGTNP